MSKAKAKPRNAPPAEPEHPDEIIYVVDDDAAVRDSLELLMSSVGRRVETFASADAFLERFDAETSGVILLDVRMPGMGGIQLHQRLTELGVTLPVIILTAHADVPMAVRAMRAGVFDFIEKPCNEQVLLERVGKALESAAQKAAEFDQRREARQLVDALSPREREVMELVVAGYLNKQIAMKLSVSERTVEVHRSRVMTKTGADSLPDLVRTATLLGIGISETETD